MVRLGKLYSEDDRNVSTVVCLTSFIQVTDWNVVTQGVRDRTPSQSLIRLTVAVVMLGQPTQTQPNSRVSHSRMW